MLPLDGLNICSWCGYGCALMLNRAQVPLPQGCQALWRGYLIITQAGTPHFGQWSNVEVAFDGTIYFVSRDCGGGIVQTASLGNAREVILSGTPYAEISGPSSGHGTGGATCAIWTMGQS